MIMSILSMAMSTMVMMVVMSRHFDVKERRVAERFSCWFV
jgi:hypothetical protein